MHKDFNSWDYGSELPLGYSVWSQTSHVSSSPLLHASPSPGMIENDGDLSDSCPEYPAD